MARRGAGSRSDRFYFCSPTDGTSQAETAPVFLFDTWFGVRFVRYCVCFARALVLGPGSLCGQRNVVLYRLAAVRKTALE